jgi:type II secretory pathway pseudopilin PulG
MSNGNEREQKSSPWPWILLGCGIVGGFLLIVAVIAAIAIPSLLAARRSSLETNSVGSCRTYSSSQTMYKRNDWDGDGKMEYATPYTKLSSQVDTDGISIQLIDSAFAAAAGANGSPKHGYIYQDMTSINGNKIDWEIDYGLSGIPAIYGRTGYRTFIISTNGTVFGQDQGSGGSFVQDYPLEPTASGWNIAE